LRIIAGVTIVERIEGRLPAGTKAPLMPKRCKSVGGAGTKPAKSAPNFGVANLALTPALVTRVRILAKKSGV
jgi:hypothetical protein